MTVAIWLARVGDRDLRVQASVHLAEVLSTDARNDNQGGRRRTAVLRRQSDDSRRIDRDALGRFRGRPTRVKNIRLADLPP